MFTLVPGDARLGCSCSVTETHFMKLSTHSSWAQLKATWSLEVCSNWLCRKLSTSEHKAHLHLLTLLCAFRWLSCGCYRKWGNFITGLVAEVPSYHRTTLEFTELLRGSNSFKNVCRSCFHPKVIEFIHLLTWKLLEHLNDQWSVWVSEYFCQYSVCCCPLTLVLTNVQSSLVRPRY